VGERVDEGVNVELLQRVPETEKFIIRQPPMLEKHDYDSENSGSQFFRMCGSL